MKDSASREEDGEKEESLLFLVCSYMVLFCPASSELDSRSLSAVPVDRALFTSPAPSTTRPFYTA